MIHFAIWVKRTLAMSGGYNEDILFCSFFGNVFGEEYGLCMKNGRAG